MRSTNSTAKKGDKRSVDETSSVFDLSSPTSTQSFTGFVGSPVPLRFDLTTSSCDPITGHPIISYQPVIKKTKWAHKRNLTVPNSNGPNPNTTQPQLVIQKFISKSVEDDNTTVSRIRGFHARSQTHKDGILKGLNSTFNHADMYGNVIAGIF